MSRIDQAMQRAAAQGGAPPEGMTAIPPADAMGAVAPGSFPGEALPVELPQEPPSASHGSLPPTPAAIPPGGTGSQARPSGHSVFERMDARLTEKVVVDMRTNAVSREQYRRLAAILHDAQGTSNLGVIMVASAHAGEGKTLTAANLALTFSESYQRRVLLIDADLRRPALDGLFRLNTVTGLSDGLGNPEAKLVVRQVSSRLAVLPAGRPSADPMAGLTSGRMRQLLAEARSAFDWVIVDTPPLGLLPDAHLLASMVDGAVLVIRAGATPHAAIKRAVDAVGRTRILGVVLNGADASPTEGYYNQYGYGQHDRTHGNMPVRT
jgi:protein-tyrosine kinase